MCQLCFSSDKQMCVWSFKIQTESHFIMPFDFEFETSLVKTLKIRHYFVRQTCLEGPVFVVPHG